MSRIKCLLTKLVVSFWKVQRVWPYWWLENDYERCLAVVTESCIAVVRLTLNEVDCRLMII